MQEGGGACAEAYALYEAWEGARRIVGPLRVASTGPGHAAMRLNARVQAAVLRHEEIVWLSHRNLQRSRRFLDRLHAAADGAPAPPRSTLH